MSKEKPGEKEIKRVIFKLNICNEYNFNGDPYIEIVWNNHWECSRHRPSSQPYPITDKCKGWKQGYKNPFILGNEQDSSLFQIMENLIIRTTEDIGPLELEAIGILGKDIMGELEKRFLIKREETKTQKNELNRYLRNELKRFKK